MKHIVYNKLVRDRIPDIIAASGKRCDTCILSEEEYLAMLRTKLHEELAEYEESGELEELADILEILHALAELVVVRQRNWKLCVLIKQMSVGDSQREYS